jgi:putative drug exporter of the RND superfamily
VALFTVVDRAAGISYSTSVTLPDSPSAQALAIVTHEFPADSGVIDQIVVEAKTGSGRSAPVRSEVEAMLAKVEKLPRVASVVSPYGPHGAGQVSRDGKIAFAIARTRPAGTSLRCRKHQRAEPASSSLRQRR